MGYVCPRIIARIIASGERLFFRDAKYFARPDLGELILEPV